MASLLCNTTAAGLLLPARRRASACSVAPSATISLRRRSLPARGLCCAGADWADLSFVGVAYKPDEEGAAPARVSAGGAGEEEKEFGAINDVGGASVQEHVVVPFTPLEQSLVTVDSVRGETLSQGIRTKLDFKEASAYVMYGTGAFFAGWLLSAVVSAIDSIPVLPKMLEIVGLGYIIWFSIRYLRFKENRDELFVEIDELKRRIIG